MTTTVNTTQVSSFSVVLDDVVPDLRAKLPSGFALAVCDRSWDTLWLKQAIDILSRRWEGDVGTWEDVLRYGGDLCLLKMQGEEVEGCTVFRLLVAPEMFQHASVMQFVFTAVNKQGVGTATALQCAARMLHARLAELYGKPDRYELVYCDASSVGFWKKQYTSGWCCDPDALAVFEHVSAWLAPDIAMAQRGTVVPLMHRHTVR